MAAAIQALPSDTLTAEQLRSVLREADGEEGEIELVQALLDDIVEQKPSLEWRGMRLVEHPLSASPELTEKLRTYVQNRTAAHARKLYWTNTLEKAGSAVGLIGGGIAGFVLTAGNPLGAVGGGVGGAAAGAGLGYVIGQCL